MLFNSLEFLIFLSITFAVFWLCPNRWRWLPGLIASMYFYIYWNPKLVFLIIFTTVISFFCGILTEKYRDNRRIKRLTVAATMVACLGVLLFFKYFNFIWDTVFDVASLFGAGKAPGYFDIMLPVGISFYTFQTASYVIDVYKGDIKAERHFGYYALFVSFFPQLVAGPIERPGALLPQLHADKSIKKVDYVGAFRFMMVGFFKKIAIADAIGIFVNATYENIEAANGLSALISSVLFAAQIYCDFSGYSDIAVGCAKLFGVNLTENFKTPYASKSIKEFWNRWHLSLSQWLRDYIFFPLGGSRVKRARWAFNVFVVFFVSGLWHGASYNYIIWGLMHAAFQVIGFFTLKPRNKLWEKLGRSPEGKFVSALRRFGTFCLVTFSWIFFRADTTADAFAVIGKIFTDHRFSVEYIKETVELLTVTPLTALYTVTVLLMLLYMEKLKYPEQLKETENPRLRSSLRFASYAVMAWFIIVVWVVLQAADVGSSFIYFQF